MGTASGFGPPRETAEADGLPERVRFTPGSIVRAVLIVVGVVVVLQVIGAASTPIVWFAEGVTGAALLFPVVALLSRKMPHWCAVGLVSVGLVLIVGLIGFRIFSELRGEANQFQQDAPQLAADIEANPTIGEAAKQFGLGDKVESLANDVAGGFNFSDASVSTLSTAASLGSAAFVVWLFGVMMLFSAPSFVAGAGRQMENEARRERMTRVLRTGYVNGWRYFALSAARSVSYGAATWIVAWAFGLRAPTLLAVWVTVWTFVPCIGLLLGGALVAAVGMFTSFSVAGWVFLGYFVVQMLDVHFLQRRIDRSTVHVGPALTMVVAMVGFGLYGFGGTVVGCAALFFVLAMLDEVRPVPPVHEAPGRAQENVST